MSTWQSHNYVNYVPTVSRGSHRPSSLNRMVSVEEAVAHIMQQVNASEMSGEYQKWQFA